MKTHETTYTVDEIRDHSRYLKEMWDNPDDVQPIAAAMLDQLMAQSEWQPIETAPKDGTAIWLYDGEMLIGQWDTCTNEGWTFELDMGKPYHPTHWMPLPAPPNTKEIE